MLNASQWKSNVAVYDLFNEGGECVMYPISSINNETLADDMAHSLNESTGALMEQCCEYCGVKTYGYAETICFACKAKSDLNQLDSQNEFTLHCDCESCDGDSLETQITEALDYLDGVVTAYDKEIAQCKATMEDIERRMTRLYGDKSSTQSMRDAIVDEIFGSQGELEEEIFNQEEMEVHNDLNNQTQYESSHNITL